MRLAKVWALTRVNVVMALYQMNLLRRRQSDRRGRGFGPALVGLMVLLMAYLGWWAWVLNRPLSPLGLQWVLLALGLVIGAAVVFTTGLTTIDAMLFDSSDIDLLFAAPLTKLEIVTAKIAGLVIENWILAVVFGLPFIVIYATSVQPPPLFYPFALVALLLVPGVPLAAMALISYLVGFIASGARFKRYFSTMLTVALVAGLAVGINVLARSDQFGLASPQELLDGFARRYPPTGRAVAALHSGSVVDLVWAAVWNVVPFLAVCLVIAASYGSIRSRQVVVGKATRRRLAYGSATPARALLRKEFARFFYSPMYILNSSIGGLLLIVFTVLFGRAGSGAGQLVTALKGAGIHVDQALLVIFLLMLSLANTTGPSISLEGKSLWVVQSSPVAAGTVLRVKAALQVVVLTPLLIIACLIAVFTLPLGFAGFGVIFIPCLLLIVASALVGLVFNLHYHRFDFVNDMQVVKNGASVMLTWLTVLAFNGLAVLLYWLLGRSVGVNLPAYWAGYIVVLLGAIIVLSRYLTTRGAALFETLA